MNEKIEKISSYLKVDEIKKDKRVVPFLICLLIATAAWFFNALGKEYRTTITCPVKYVNAPDNRFLSNKPVENLDLKVNAHGFALLRYKLNIFSSPLILNLKTISEKQVPENGIYKLETNTLLSTITKQIGSEINVTEVVPSTIKLILDSLKTKMVEVNPQVTLDFMPQFNLRTPISVSPSKVKITGSASIIDTLNFINTKHQTFNELDETLISSVNIDAPEGLSISPREVKLQIEVEKFTEKEIQIPIQVINNPDDVSVKLFPSSIKLDCMVGLGEFDKITAENFNAIVNFADISDNSTKLTVSITDYPSFVKVVRFSPEAVEYLIEKK